MVSRWSVDGPGTCVEGPGMPDTGTADSLRGGGSTPLEEDGEVQVGLRSSKHASRMGFGTPGSMELSSSSGMVSEEVVVVRSRTSSSRDCLLLLDMEELSKCPDVAGMDSGVEDAMECS